MLKLTTAVSLVLLTVTPALAQVTRETTTTTTTVRTPAPQAAPMPAPVTVTPLPPDPSAGPGDGPHVLGTMEEKIIHPGTVTTSGSSTTVTVPDRVIGTTGGRRDSTEIHIGVP